MPHPYTGDFFESLREGAHRSAEAIVPLVVDLIRPESVIDVGCGTGSWLRVFKRHGIRNVLGVDGEYVKTDQLEIAPHEFKSWDLQNPLALDRRFDLVVSLEVGEHLPQDCAETFVESLAGLGPVVLFSAAIPSQGGTAHLNEQWPDYWAKRFKKRGYVAIDAVRARFWDRKSIEKWYVQNILLFIESGHLETHPELAVRLQAVGAPLSVVHPRFFLDLQEKYAGLLEMNRRIEQESGALRAKAQSYFEENERLKAESEKHRATAEHHIAESEGHKKKAEFYFDENERIKAEAERHRTDAESYRAESKIFRKQAESYAKLCESLRYQAEPRNMRLGRYLLAIPAVILGSMRGWFAHPPR